jgi:hypothetical protein
LKLSLITPKDLECGDLGAIPLEQT